VGKAGAAGGPTASADDDDDLHVHIQGETEESVEAAAKLVQELLVPVEDDKNEHKQKQLRELVSSEVPIYLFVLAPKSCLCCFQALINGTLREDEFCQVCGERGHKHFECPHRSKTFKAANVKCAICGDQSHPTRDCPLKESGPTNEIALDNEYDSFIAELGGGGPPASAAAARPADGAIGGSTVTASGTSNEYSDSTTIATTSDGVTSVTERFLGNKKQTIIESKVVLTGWGVQPAAAPSSSSAAAVIPAAGYGDMSYMTPGAMSQQQMDPASMAAYQAYQQQYYAYYGCYYDPQQLMYGAGYATGGAGDMISPPLPPQAPPPPPA
jgi:splicing factor 1